MTLGQDILAAVISGGQARWATTTKREVTDHLKRRHHLTKERMTRILAILDKPLNTIQITERLNVEAPVNRSTVSKDLVKMCDAGMIVRSIKGQPYKYWRA